MTTTTAPIETLMKEHRLIEKVLGSLETFVSGDRAAGKAAGVDLPDARSQVSRYTDFFRGFADRVHHAKEEDGLFRKMNEYGFPRDGGPIAVMLAEHAEGRLHVGAIHAVGAGGGPLSPAERAAVVGHAGAFIPLLRAHIQKEDNILYPMAENVLPPAVMTLLAEAFAELERVALGAGSRATYETLAADLVAAFPPDPAKMEAAAMGMGCGTRRTG